MSTVNRNERSPSSSPSEVRSDKIDMVTIENLSEDLRGGLDCTAGNCRKEVKRKISLVDRSCYSCDDDLHTNKVSETMKNAERIRRERGLRETKSEL